MKQLIVLITAVALALVLAPTASATVLLPDAAPQAIRAHHRATVDPGCYIYSIVIHTGPAGELWASQTARFVPHGHIHRFHDKVGGWLCVR